MHVYEVVENYMYIVTNKYGKGSLDNDYFDNFNNEFSNKYEKNLKNRKKLYRYVLLLID
jgi:hypothetical protein